MTPRGDVAVVGEPVPAVYVKVGAATAAAIAQAIVARHPGAPRLRGLFVVLPIDLLAEPGRSSWADPIRDDLDAIRAAADLDLPAYLVVTGMERTPGFLELAAMRGPQAEWGVALPRARDADEPERSLAEFSGRIRRRTLRALRKWFPDRRLNARLYGAGARSQSLRPALMAACEAVFPADADEPTYLRGIFLAATGAAPEEWAYAGYPLRLQVRGDEGEAAWSDRAIRADRAERRRAWRLALTGALAASAAWAYILFGLGSLGLVGRGIAAGLATSWALALTAMAWRWPAPAGQKKSHVYSKISSRSLN
jgi:hypothetical protein